jgi:hypothetical protein
MQNLRCFPVIQEVFLHHWSATSGTSSTAKSAQKLERADPGTVAASRAPAPLALRAVGGRHADLRGEAGDHVPRHALPAHRKAPFALERPVKTAHQSRVGPVLFPGSAYSTADWAQWRASSSGCRSCLMDSPLG